MNHIFWMLITLLITTGQVSGAEISVEVESHANNLGSPFKSPPMSLKLERKLAELEYQLEKHCTDPAEALRLQEKIAEIHARIAAYRQQALAE